MPIFQIIQPTQYTQWMDVLERSCQYDFYHTPDYHLLAQEQGEGQPYLFVFSDQPYMIALPLLLRPVTSIPGLEKLGEGWWDATSVYGYAGPVASHCEIPERVAQTFHAHLCAVLRQKGVVAVFSRLHPLLPQRAWLSAAGECLSLGPTVSIDLTLLPEQQRAQYRSNHRRDIRKLISMGMTCVWDREQLHLDTFIDMYYERMRQLNASDDYFFAPAYFRRLVDAPNLHLQHFYCTLDDQIICGGLFSLCNGIVQYHLGTTKHAYMRLSPTKLLFDTVREWAIERNAHVFHLGGGVGAKEDSLFHFKAGFSHRRHEFATWNWVLLPDVYHQLCLAKEHWNSVHALHSVSQDFFPAFRSPTVAFRSV